MEPERKTPGPAATGTEGCNVEVRQSETSIQGLESQEEGALRTALLAELRQDFILAKFDLLEIERLGIALKNGLISVRQCLALQRDPSTLEATS
jgi:hypothetical protein